KRAGQQIARGSQRHITVFIRRHFLQRAREPSNLHAAAGGAEHVREEFFGFGPADLSGGVEQTETEREWEKEVIAAPASGSARGDGGKINVFVAVEKIANGGQRLRSRGNELLQPVDCLATHASRVGGGRLQREQLRDDLGG